MGKASFLFRIETRLAGSADRFTKNEHSLTNCSQGIKRKHRQMYFLKRNRKKNSIGKNGEISLSMTPKMQGSMEAGCQQGFSSILPDQSGQSTRSIPARLAVRVHINALAGQKGRTC
jgi:hypothetical protein